MKVLHTIAGFGAKSGGTSTCTYDLLAAMHARGGECEVDLLTVDVRDASDRIMGQGEEWIHALPNDCRTQFGFSRNIRRAIASSDYDIYHTNGLWLYCNHATTAVARRKGRPYVITPHGMLYPQALARSAWKKRLLLDMCFRGDILSASCIHATCNEEMNVVRRFGYEGPIAVIANPVVIPDYAAELVNDRSIVRFGFLGRLHPRKKVENILYAASLTQRQDEFRIEVMGKGNDDYENFLRKEAGRLNLRNVEFCGFVNGREKYERLSALSVLLVPSDFENFGMIITEALSVGTPVMASLGTPWEELDRYGCGWWLDRTPENIARVMNEVLDMPSEQLAAMGERGRMLIADKYSALKVAQQMQSLYEWLATGGVKPDFVYE